jgi:hypothetical protein
VSCSTFIARFLQQVYSKVNAPVLEVYVASEYFDDCDRTDRAILVSERQDAGDVLVFGLYVEEHGMRAAHPYTVYIQYLEKTGLADASAVRKPSLVTAVLVAYMHFVSCLAPHTVHIWADPPDEEDPDFVFTGSHRNTPPAATKGDGDLTGMYKYIAAQGGWAHRPFEYRVAVPAMPVFNVAETAHDWHHADVKSKPHVRAMIAQLQAEVARMTAAINAELRTTVVVDVPQRACARDASAAAGVPAFMQRRSVLTADLPFDGEAHGRASSAVLLRLLRACPAAVDMCSTAPEIPVPRPLRSPAAAARLPAPSRPAVPPGPVCAAPNVAAEMLRVLAGMGAGDAACALSEAVAASLRRAPPALVAACERCKGARPRAAEPPDKTCAGMYAALASRAAVGERAEVAWARASAVPRVVDIIF